MFSLWLDLERRRHRSEPGGGEACAAWPSRLRLADFARPRVVLGGTCVEPGNDRDDDGGVQRFVDLALVSPDVGERFRLVAQDVVDVGRVDIDVPIIVLE